jgi:hypothetical protein
MSNEWMADEVKAGAALAEGLVPDLQHPVRLGVRLGTAVGRIAATIYRTKGQPEAEAFLITVAAVLNQETIQVDPTEQLSVRANC